MTITKIITPEPIMLLILPIFFPKLLPIILLMPSPIIPIIFYYVNKNDVYNS